VRARIYTPCLRSRCRTTETAMFDVVLVSVGFAFFFAAILYTVACDRL
jgi:hypothetical protein